MPEPLFTVEQLDEMIHRPHAVVRRICGCEQPPVLTVRLVRQWGMALRYLPESNVLGIHAELGRFKAVLS